GQAGGEQHQQVIEEPAPVLRVALDQVEVLGGEHHAAHDPEHIAGAAHRGAVQASTVGPTGHDLQLDERLPPGTPNGLGPDHGAAGPVPHQGGVGCDPVAGEGTQVGDRLHDVGLALPVVADEGGHATIEGEDELAVGAEVVQREVGDVHLLA